jgi:hypothetical protein
MSNNIITTTIEKNSYIKIIFDDYQDFLNGESDEFALHMGAYTREFLDIAYSECVDVVNLFAKGKSRESQYIHAQFLYLLEAIEERVKLEDAPSESFVDYFDLPEREFNFNR